MHQKKTSASSGQIYFVRNKMGKCVRETSYKKTSTVFLQFMIQLSFKVLNLPNKNVRFCLKGSFFSIAL